MILQFPTIDNHARALLLSLLVVAVPTASSAQQSNRLVAVDVEEAHGGRVVRLRTTEEPTFTVFRLSNPMRVVVDISGGDISQLEGPITIEDGVVAHIAMRQFQADGFSIARVIVGFEQDVSYDVQVDGKAVLIKAGASSGAPVVSVRPPPAKPTEQDNAELEKARTLSEQAAAKAQQERQAALIAAEAAKKQQLAAADKANEAQKLAQQAHQAKAEAERLHRELQASAEQERQAAEAAWNKAEERLERINEQAREIERRRAEAERLAAQAQQAHKAAEDSAAQAEAQHKEQLAQLQQLRAQTEQEKEAAKKAQARAARAQEEALQARRAADKARQEFEQAKGETESKLQQIAKRERALQEKERELQEQAKAREEKTQREAAKALMQMDEKLRIVKGREAELQAREAKLKQERAKLHQQTQERLQAANQASHATEAERKRAEKQAKQKLAEIAQREQALRQTEAALADKRQALQQEAQAIARAKAEKKAHATRLAEQKLQEVQKRERALEEREAKLAQEREALARQAEERAAAARKAQAHRSAKEREKARQEAQQKLAEIAAREKALLEKEQALAAQKLALQAKSQELVHTKQSKPVQVASLTPTHATKQSLELVDIKSAGPDVIIQLSGTPRFESQRLADPPRFVVDLKNTDKGALSWEQAVNHAHVKKVRLGPHGSTLRAVFDLQHSDVEHTVQPRGNQLVVSLQRPAQGGDTKPLSAGLPRLKDLRFSTQGNTAVVQLDIAPNVKASVDDRSAKAWVLRLNGASIPKTLERSLDTESYNSVVRLVSSYQATDNTVNVVANLQGKASHKLERTATGLEWRITGAPAQPQARAEAPQSAGFASQAKSLARSIPQQSNKKRVNMNLREASLVEVVRFIAEITGQNVIVAEDVKGKVTVNLRNVPWDQALDMILKSRGYDKVIENNIIRVASTAALQKEKEAELARRQAALELEDPVIKLITVNYANANEVAAQLKPLLSGKGSVQVDPRTNTIIAEDLRANLDRLVELTRRLDRQTPQVLIEARIVEATSIFEQELGIQWGGTFQASSMTGNPTGLQFPSSIIASGAGDDMRINPDFGVARPGRFAVNLPTPITAGGGGGVGFVFGSANNAHLLNLRLTAMEQNGVGRIISSPRVTTLDNRTAKIAQGVDIPISVVSAAGVNTRFIPANLELEVTPHVTNDGSILMQIKAAKNEPDFTQRGAQGDPTIVRKFAETEVLVRDSDTAVIGGIYTRNTTDTFTEIPFFSKIPVLGWLFKKRRQEDRRAELLVFITPRIVNREESVLEQGSGDFQRMQIR